LFIFAHVGITLGLATLISGGIRKYHVLRNGSHGLSDTVLSSKNLEEKETFWDTIGLKSLSEFLDIRILVVGSLFPDIIDKPLEFIGFSDGRSVTHTLIVTLFVLVTGLFLFINYKKTWLLAIAIGMSTHLFLDSMWLAPHTLFWPTYGWSFPRPTHGAGFAQISLWWSTLKSNISVDITEGIGAATIFGVVWLLARGKRLKIFITKGII
jgi:inner membrane protein